MPKIILTNTATGEPEQFEPVDAREILATPNSQYEADEEARKMLGMQFDPGAREDGVNIPQLQGDDNELQTGLSVEKYGRSQVVKAVPSMGTPGTGQAQTTTGRPLNEGQQKREQKGQAKAIREAQRAEGRSQGGGQSNAADKVANRATERAAEQQQEEQEEMTVEAMKAHLDAKGVAYPARARKPDLQKLVDANP